MSEAPCRISIILSPENETRDLATVLKAEMSRRPPLLVWTEPDVNAVSLGNRTGRRSDFRALVSGNTDWPADLLLVEARLFWETSALHLVADDTSPGCRWLRIEERDDGKEEVMRRQIPVHTLQDRQRFGLPGNGEELAAVEYLRQGRLIGWRLLPGNVGRNLCRPAMEPSNM